MIIATTILILSTGLFFFYLQTLCEKVLRRKFSRAYSQDVFEAANLEFPRVRHAFSGNMDLDYSQVRLALKFDFTVLTYLATKANPRQRHLSLPEMVLLAYFRLLFHWLSICHVLRIREKQSVMKLTAILDYLANLVGERVSSMSAEDVVMGLQS